MVDDSMIKYSAPGASRRKDRRVQAPPPRPLFDDELAESLQNRPALTKLVDATVDLDLSVSALGEPEISVDTTPFDGAYLSGRDAAELKRSTPWHVRLAIRNAAVGVHVFPPRAEIVEFKPEHDIREAQLDFPHFEPS